METNVQCSTLNVQVSIKDKSIYTASAGK